MTKMLLISAKPEDIQKTEKGIIYSVEKLQPANVTKTIPIINSCRSFFLFNA